MLPCLSPWLPTRLLSRVIVSSRSKSMMPGAYEFSISMSSPSSKKRVWLSGSKCRSYKTLNWLVWPELVAYPHMNPLSPEEQRRVSNMVLPKEKAGYLVITTMGLHCKTSGIAWVEGRAPQFWRHCAELNTQSGVWDSVGPWWCQGKSSKVRAKKNKSSHGGYPITLVNRTLSLSQILCFFTIKEGIAVLLGLRFMCFLLQ